MAKLKLKIDGMSCEMCVASVKETLESLGVTDVNVKIGSATGTYDESKLSEERIISAIIDTGFTAKVKKGLF